MDELFKKLNGATDKAEKDRLSKDFLKLLDETHVQAIAKAFSRTVPDHSGVIHGNAYRDAMWKIIEVTEEQTDKIEKLNLELTRRKAQILNLQEELVERKAERKAQILNFQEELAELKVEITDLQEELAERKVEIADLKKIV